MISAWMNWNGGVDLVATTAPGMEQPNVIIHVARMVHTPVGSAPSGLVLFAPVGMPPQIMGFVAGDETVGAYFGPHIFAGTPFENAPVLRGQISIESGDDWCSARVQLEHSLIETRLEGLQKLEEISREAGALPFAQRGLEAVASRVTVKIDGENVEVFVPEIGISGGAAAVWSPCGMYLR